MAMQQRSVVETVWRRIALAATLPPVVGLGMIVVVLGGWADHTVLRSDAAMSSALIVGALLILLPPAVYSKWPSSYAEYQTALELRARELASGDRAQLDKPE